jgi:hypothetical protein
MTTTKLVTLPNGTEYLCDWSRNAATTRANRKILEAANLTDAELRELLRIGDNAAIALANARSKARKAVQA